MRLPRRNRGCERNRRSQVCCGRKDSCRARSCAVEGAAWQGRTGLSWSHLMILPGVSREISLWFSKPKLASFRCKFGLLARGIGTCVGFGASNSKCTRKSSEPCIDCKSGPGMVQVKYNLRTCVTSPSLFSISSVTCKSIFIGDLNKERHHHDSISVFGKVSKLWAWDTATHDPCDWNQGPHQVDGIRCELNNRCTKAERRIVRHVLPHNLCQERVFEMQQGPLW